ncbi:MAG: TPR repeat protein [Gammaproteobacteria bacterium]|jgi:TPR repeat protein
MKDPIVSLPSKRRRATRAALTWGILIALAVGCGRGGLAYANPSIESALGALQRLDYDGAAKILNHLAASGDARAKAALGALIESRSLSETYPIPAIELLRDAANSGLGEAALELGNRYYLGGDVQQDYAEAIKWWANAADSDSGPAAFNVGLAFAKGHGRERDLDKARHWFSQAAQSGSHEAQFALGVLSVEARRYPTALTHFESAADAGSAFAAYNLGVMHEQGLGTSVDLENAIDAYRRAAAADLPVARDSLQRLGALLSARSSEPPGPIHGSEWVRRQAAHRFVLQVATGATERATVNILGRYAENITRAYLEVNHDGRNRFLALIGSFETYLEAISYLNALEPALRTDKPWIRRFGTVQAFSNAPSPSN